MQGLAMKKFLFNDLTDFIDYCLNNKNFSGIQRVQHDMLKAMLLQDEYQIIPVAFRDRKIQIYPANDFLNWSSIPDIALRRDSWIELEKKAVNIGFMEALTSIINDADVSFLINGGPWNIKNYSEIVAFFKFSLNSKILMLIHDLIPLHHPEYFEKELVTATTRFYKNNCALIDEFWTVSSKTFDDIKYLYQFSSNKIIVKEFSNMHGISFLPKLTELVENPKAVKGDYVLFVSTVEKRKNHILLARVWKELCLRDANNTPTLICVGKKGWMSDDFYQTLGGDKALREKIKILSGVSDLELSHLYKNCLYTVYPALEEGFGLPVSEALSQGKLCVSGTCKSLKQASQGLSICLNEYDANEWIAELSKLNLNRSLIRKREKIIASKFKIEEIHEYSNRLVNQLNNIKPLSKNNSYPELKSNQELVFYKPLVASSEVSQNISNYKLPILGGIGLDSNFNENFLGLLAGDWHESEDWGRWGKFPVSNICINTEARLRENNNYLLVRLKCPEPLLNCNISIFLNNQVLWTGKLSEDPKNMILKIRAGDLLSDINRLTFLYDYKSVNLQALKNLDARLLGVGLISLVFLDAEDPKNMQFFMDKIINIFNSKIL
jgi:glycosyltransferase involved in cell wall biosynthesis